jgi:predicted O-methyltransferase YrrM
MPLAGKKVKIPVNEKVIFQTKSKFGHYQVIDMVYMSRTARVLFSGKHEAAQSGIPKDGNPRMLFDYNQRFLELIESLKPKTILLIGGGVFTLPVEILKTFPAIKISAVEIDAELKAVAGRFFGLKPDKRLKIIIGDGREYLKLNPKTYDLILIDAFTHSRIPPALATKEFVELVSQRLNKNGVAASNVISAYHGPNDEILKQQFATYKSVFRHVGIFPADKILSYWISQNFLLISTDRFRKPKYNLRLESLRPPPISTEDIQYDK